MAKYVFIAGNGHSGSTLLDLLLGSHPLIISIGELKQFARYIKERKDCTCGTIVAKCEFWTAVRNIILVQTEIDVFENPDKFPLSIQNSKNRLVHSSRQAVRLIILSLPRQIAFFLLPLLKAELRVAKNALVVYDAVQQVSGIPIVVDSSKSPIVMKLLSILRPTDVKCIHIVRDGRAVLNSNLKKGKGLEFAIKSWVKTLELLEVLSKNLRKEQFFVVKYEDLCLGSEKVLRTVADFLDVKFDERMLEFRGVERHNIDGNRMRYATTNEIRLDEKWARELGNEQLEKFEDIAGGYNRKFGYK